jgi:hypothetical protein
MTVARRFIAGSGWSGGKVTLDSANEDRLEAYATLRAVAGRDGFWTLFSDSDCGSRDK